MTITTTITEDNATTVSVSHDADTPTLFADLLHDYQYDSAGRTFEWPHRHNLASFPPKAPYFTCLCGTSYPVTNIPLDCPCGENLQNALECIEA